MANKESEIDIVAQAIKDVNGWVIGASRFQVESEDFNDQEAHELARYCLREAEILALDVPELRRLNKLLQEPVE